MRRIQIIIDDKSHWVFAHKTQEQLWYHYLGETQVIELHEKKAQRHRDTKKAETGIIISPMPGKLIKIFKSTGDDVKIGETIIVLEAMKMEYSLEADCTGIINNINAIEGQQVKLGDVLVNIDKVKND